MTYKNISRLATFWSQVWSWRRPRRHCAAAAAVAACAAAAVAAAVHAPLRGRRWAPAHRVPRRMCPGRRPPLHDPRRLLAAVAFSSERAERSPGSDAHAPTVDGNRQAVRAGRDSRSRAPPLHKDRRTVAGEPAQSWKREPSLGLAARDRRLAPRRARLTTGVAIGRALATDRELATGPASATGRASPTGLASATGRALATGRAWRPALIGGGNRPGVGNRPIIGGGNNIVNRPGGNNNFVNINTIVPAGGWATAGMAIGPTIGTITTFLRTITAGITAVGAGTGATTGMRRWLPARRPGA